MMPGLYAREEFYSAPFSRSAGRACAVFDDARNVGDEGWKSKSPRYIAICLALLVFVFQLGASLFDVSSAQVLKDIICRRRLIDNANGTMVDTQCLGGHVQAELDKLSTGSFFSDHLIGKFYENQSLSKEKRSSAS